MVCINHGGDKTVRFKKVKYELMKDGIETNKSDNT